MAAIYDLRAFRRVGREGIVAHIGGDFVQVIDISIAGVRLSRPFGDLPHRNVEFRIIPCTAMGLNFRGAIPVSGHIVGGGADHVRISFAAVTAALANLVGRSQAGHIRTGVQEYPVEIAHHAT